MPHHQYYTCSNTCQDTRHRIFYPVSDLPHSPLGRRVKEALASADISVTDVAERLGIARAGFSARLNAGRLKPAELAVVASLTGRSLDWMAGATDPHGAPSERQAGRSGVEVTTHRTPMGDAVLVAVGRFEAIEEMAAELSKMAGRSGKDLARAFRAPSLPETRADGRPTIASQPATPRLRKHRP